MDIEEFKKTNLYKELVIWLTNPHTTNWYPSDSEIEIAKHIWILSEKDNSDFVLGQLNWLGYFD